MDQHDDCLCNREERISNLFLHQPMELRSYFDEALRYRNEKWRLLQWDSITEYYITAHSRYTADENTGTAGTPPRQDTPEQNPQGNQYCKIHGENNTHNTKQCRFTDEPYNLDADACEQYRKLKICVFHMRGMCKRPNCDLKHISKAQAIEMGLPPTTHDAVMHPLIIPKEPEPFKEGGNRLPGVEDDNGFANLNEFLDSHIDDIMTPKKTKEMYHAILDISNDY